MDFTCLEPNNIFIHIHLNLFSLKKIFYHIIISLWGSCVYIYIFSLQGVKDWLQNMPSLNLDNTVTLQNKGMVSWDISWTHFLQHLYFKHSSVYTSKIEEIERYRSFRRYLKWNLFFLGNINYNLSIWNWTEYLPFYNVHSYWHLYIFSQVCWLLW